ncbi:MAG: HAD-IA family hydrolase, partial [Muribaculaceae bacterium]|nr:HAD-IA family hydrolase [Muribaculaceae bacterium]
FLRFQMAQMELKPDIHYHGTVAVFDLDDTLIRERDFCRTGFQAISDYLSAHHGEERFKHLAHDMTAALEQRQSYIEVLEKALSPDLTHLKNRVLDIYGSHLTPSITPCHGVTETLQALSKRGVKMGIITDGRSRTQRAKLQSANLIQFFSPDMIYISEERGVDKSSPESFAEIVRKYPEAKKFVYIGDNPDKDILTPTLLGWETIILAYNHDNAHIPNNNADISGLATYKDVEFTRILQIIS